VYEYQEEEDQGQANQGKPSILDAYLILFTYFACFLKFNQKHVLLLLLLLSRNCWRLGSMGHILSSSWDETFIYTYIPLDLVA
jgi:hypothetical protein